MSASEEKRADGEREPAVVLYRCRTPTNYLCPCGAVARRLAKLEVPYRTERVSQRRGDRPEIVELTGQRHVPVLVDGDEVIHDSKRIIQHLERVHGERGARGERHDHRDH